MRWIELLRRCADFTKNNIVGVLIFSIVTSVLGNFVYDAVKSKDPQAASLVAAPVGPASPIIELAASSEKTPRTTLKSDASPAQIPSASVANTAGPDVSPAHPVSQRASRTQAPMTSTAKPHDHDGTAEPATLSPHNRNRKIEDYRNGIAKAPNPVLYGGGYHLELTGCTRKGSGAECTVTVTANANVIWFLTGRDKLVTKDGSAIPVSSMTVGSRTVSFGGRRAGVNYEKIEAGLTSQITFRFDAAVEPEQVQALVVAVGAALAGRTVALSPIPWN